VRLGEAEEALLAQLESAGAPEAAERFRVTGLPTRRIEAYHYTDLKSLIRNVPELAGVANEAIGSPMSLPDGAKISILNGIVGSPGDLPPGVRAGKVNGSSLDTRDDVIVRFNTALARESLHLTLSGDIGGVVQVDRQMIGKAAHILDSMAVSVADGTKAILVETISSSDAAHLGNHATHIDVGKGAEFTHIVVDYSARAATHFANVEYRIEDGAKLRSMVVHAGAALARTQIFAEFLGEGAHADFGGLNLSDEGQHRDITLEVSHSVPNTTSTELFKQVARGHSQAIFQGKIIVARDAQKTDAAMMTQGLMLSEQAEISVKPELEIFADDVVCGHGATCGDIDADQLFYLLSRGIAHDEAEAMLVRAFLEELFDPIEHEALHAALSEIVSDWLGSGSVRAAA
jgi:Fe-S cluster assembly protein SufD